MITSRLYSRIMDDESFKCVCDELARTQFMSRQQIRDYQFAKTKKLVRHAYENVPYYTRVFDDLHIHPNDIESFDDFATLPVLTKDIIRENFDDMIAANFDKAAMNRNSTGGSTGEPLTFYQDKTYKVWADAARRRGWYDIAGCQYGDTCAVIWGAMHEVKEDFSLYERARDYLKTGEIWLNAFNLSDDRKYEFFKFCRTARPKLLRGYTTAIADFARYLDNNNLKFPSIKGIILCAETVTDEMQNYIESIFQAPSYNTYGGRELSLIAMQCSHKNGLHEVSENNYVEYEPITLAGCAGAANLLVTNLNNYAMPFIRYRIGDIGVPSGLMECDCGRGLPLIAKIVGRTTEIFVFHDKTRIAGEMFIHLMKEFPMREYQFAQTSPREIIFRHSAKDHLSDELKGKFLDTYKKYLPDGVEIKIQQVDSFEKTPTGKFKFVYVEYQNTHS